MKKQSTRAFQICLVLIGIFSAGIVRAKPLATIENLSKAYVVESDAFNKYGKYAEQADKDGYPMVARLFRAAALSEIIHSRNHAAAIEGLGEKIQKFQLKAVNPSSRIRRVNRGFFGSQFQNLLSRASEARA